MNSRFPARILSSLGSAGRITLAYALVAALWILFSDTLVEWFAGSQQFATQIQTLKGLAFVLVTASLLHMLIRRAQASLRLTQAAVDAAADWVLWGRQDGSIGYANDIACRDLEYPLEAMLKMSITEVDSDLSSEDFADLWNETKTKGSLLIERRCRTKKGRIIPVEVHTRFFTFAGEEFLFTFVRDIAARRQTEQQLKDSEERHRSLFNTANDAIFLVQGGLFVDCNPRTLEMFHCTREQIIGESIWRLSPPKQADGRDSAAKEEEIAKAALDGQPQRFEWIHHRYDGTPFDAEVSLNRLDIGSEPLLLAVVRDITERKAAEEALRQSELRYRNLFESAGDAILTMEATDEDLFFVDCNRRAEEAWGLSREEIIGKSPLDYSPPEQRDGRLSADRVKEIISAAESGEPQVFEWQRYNADRDLYDIEVTVVRIPEAGAFRLQAIERDITERKKAERAIENALTEIRRLNEQIKAENVYLREEIRMANLHGDIVGQSEGMLDVMRQAEQVAETDSTVLILGETGTGKELLARAIHNMSPRRDKPLIIVNCAAMPAALVESELFGREKGAYTGALTRQTGRFELANGGTVFLDEIGELPGETQAKLLRVLQEGQFERLGSTDTVSVDVRVIAATNRDLKKEIREGNFREDLFFRLNVFPITIPPLRNRQDDIEPLVWSFVNEFATNMGKQIETISQTSIDALREYPWPGNIRELRNVIERAMIVARGPSLKVRPPAKSAQSLPGDVSLDEVQRRHICSVLESSNWRIRGNRGAAKILGINPSALESRMAKLGIKRPGSHT
ncbi:MAG: sigma 54-interacting transcriptional regulator [Kiritimatiellia bacterium]|jgi:PAS domain S-box-containing protein|nr:sigma 54-interacting transcriptional regulator [Kiritimatiellia bacterium]